MSKFILHLDINYFFAQVEEILEPSLIDKVVVVASRSDKSIITTSNYNARAYGIYPADTIFNAKKKYKNIIICQPKYDQYKKYSDEFFKIIKEYYTDNIEISSIDECYIDATELLEKYHNNIHILVLDIYNTILNKCKLKISIGIGNNKFLAKMANNISDKKLFYNEIYREQIIGKIYPLKISKIHNIGNKTTKYFEEKNIFLVSDFVNYKNQFLLQKELLSRYEMINNYLSGMSSDLIEIKTNLPKSISSSKTLDYLTNNELILKNIIKKLSIKIYSQLEENNLICFKYSIKLKTMNLIINKTIKIYEIVDNKEKFYLIFLKLFIENWDLEELKQITIAVDQICYRKDYKEQIRLFN